MTPRRLGNLILGAGFLGALCALPGSTAATMRAEDREAITSALEEGRYQAAMRGAARAVQRPGGDPEQLLLLARAEVESGQADRAAATLARIARREIRGQELLLVQSHIALERGAYGDALSFLGRVPAPLNQSAYAARLRVRAFSGLGDRAAIWREISQAEQTGVQDPAFWSAIGWLQLDMGDMAAAYAAGDRALAANPRYVPALILAGELAQRRYGLKASLSWFRAALDRDPDHLHALVELAAALGDIGANRQMLRVTAHIRALDPQNRWAWYFQAVMAARAGKPLLAQAMMDRVGNRLDGEAGAQLLQAVLDLARGAPERAARSLTRLCQSQPANLAARRLLAIAQWRAGNISGAQAALRPLLHRADADSYSLMLAARLSAATGDRQAEAENLSRLTQAGAFSAQPLLGGGVTGDIAAALRRGDQADALARALNWQKSSPGWPAAHLAVGDVRAATGDWAAAAAAYRDAANLRFDEATALRLAQALAMLRQPSVARQTLALYLDQNPQSPKVRLALVDLDLAAKDWPRALKQLEVLRDRLGNGDAALLARLGWAWHGMGDQRRALAYSRAAYQRLPQHIGLQSQWARVAGQAAEERSGRRSLRGSSSVLR